MILQRLDWVKPIRVQPVIKVMLSQPQPPLPINLSSTKFRAVHKIPPSQRLTIIQATTSHPLPKEVTTRIFHGNIIHCTYLELQRGVPKVTVNHRTSHAYNQNNDR